MNFPKKCENVIFFRLQRLRRETKNTYFQVFQGFPALKETVAHIQPNVQFWTVFCQNGQNGIFFQKSLWNIFLRLKAIINCKVSQKSNEGIPRKCENLHFWAFWAKMANFGQCLAKMGKTGIFQKSAWNIFVALTSPN